MKYWGLDPLRPWC